MTGEFLDGLYVHIYVYAYTRVRCVRGPCAWTTRESFARVSHLTCVPCDLWASECDVTSVLYIFFFSRSRNKFFCYFNHITSTTSSSSLRSSSSFNTYTPWAAAHISAVDFDRISGIHGYDHLTYIIQVNHWQHPYTSSCMQECWLRFHFILSFIIRHSLTVLHYSN